MTSEATPAPGDSLEPIKNVTTVEAELEARVTRLRESIKSQLEALQRETESVLLRARADAEKERESVLAAAQADGDRSAKQILAEGAQRAGGIRGKTPDELARQKDPILRAILAEFRASGKRPGA
jgi:vacuolar-type H+-ATPase subunit H